MAVLARDSTACSMPSSSSSMSAVDSAEFDLSRPLVVVLVVSRRCRGEPGNREETDPL